MVGKPVGFAFAKLLSKLHTPPPVAFPKTPESLSPVTSESHLPAMVLDSAKFPNIMELILQDSSRPTLLTFRLTSRRMRDLADQVLWRHIRFTMSGAKVLIEAGDGALPVFSSYSPLPAPPALLPPPPPGFQALVGRLVSRRAVRTRYSVVAPPPSLPGDFTRTRVIDIGTSEPPPFLAPILSNASKLIMIRLVPAVELPRYPRYTPTSPGITVVHFWMEKTWLLPSFPSHIQQRVKKVVFAIRHYCPVPERLRWYEAFNCWFPNIESVVFIFGSNGSGPRWITDPNFFHKEHRTNAEGRKYRPRMFTALVEQVARILLCTKGAVTLVALAEVPHPRLLGVHVEGPLEGTVGEELEAHFLDGIESELRQSRERFGIACNSTEVLQLMDRVEVLTMEGYRHRVGRGQFELEVHT